MNATINASHATILVALVLIPFIGGFLCWVTERFSERLPRWIALISMATVLVLGVGLWATGQFNLSEGVGRVPQWVLQYQIPWIPTLGISFHLAMDGLSLLMVVLTALLGVLAVGCSWTEIVKRVGFFHLNLLWSLGGVIGCFLAIDMFLFFFFWEMMLVPIFFLIALWGHRGATGHSRVYAATKFFIYTQVSGLVMLVGIVALVLVHAAGANSLTFDYNALLGTQMPYAAEYAIMLCFFIAFSVKLPLVPFHGWLPDAHAQAPTAGSVDLAGILIKTAAYGLLRFALPLFPHASADFANVAITMGVIGIFYGGWIAYQQDDIKRLLAYTSISHMGFVVLGIYNGNLTSLQGIMIQMLAHGLSSAALFMMSGQIYERLHTRELAKMGGMWGEFRTLPMFLMFFTAALMGIPATGNFLGEFLILAGSFNAWKWPVILATASMIVASVYGLVLAYRALFGYPAEKRGAIPDLDLREKSMLTVLVVGLLALGLYPMPTLVTSEPAMSWIHESYKVKPKAAAAAASSAHATDASKTALGNSSSSSSSSPTSSPSDTGTGNTSNQAATSAVGHSDAAGSQPSSSAASGSAPAITTQTVGGSAQ